MITKETVRNELNKTSVFNYVENVLGPELLEMARFARVVHVLTSKDIKDYGFTLSEVKKELVSRGFEVKENAVFYMPSVPIESLTIYW